MRKRVLVACEFSGIVRDAFRARGFDAWSCDLLPTEREGQHYQKDIFDVVPYGDFNLMIAFPPCTYLSWAGNRFIADPVRQKLREQAMRFFMKLVNQPIPMIAIENPKGYPWQAYRKPDQIIQPWQFGHEVSKTTCLWLKNLPLLQPTNVVDRGRRYVYTDKSGKVRSKDWWFSHAPGRQKGGEAQKIRSRTFQGIADAMADQWGAVL